MSLHQSTGKVHLSCLSLPFILSFFSLSRCPSGDYSRLRQQLVRGSNQRAAHLPGQGKPQPHHRRVEDVSSALRNPPISFLVGSFQSPRVSCVSPPPPLPLASFQLFPPPISPGAPRRRNQRSFSAAPRPRALIIEIVISLFRPCNGLCDSRFNC